FKTAFQIPSPHPLVDYSSIARRIGRTLTDHLQQENSALVQPRIDVRESPTEVQLAIHAQAQEDPGLTTASAAAMAVLSRLQWRMAVCIGVAVLDHGDEAPDAALCERACREASPMLAFTVRAGSPAQVLTRKVVPAHAVVLYRDESPSFRA